MSKPEYLGHINGKKVYLISARDLCQECSKPIKDHNTTEIRGRSFKHLCDGNLAVMQLTLF